MSTGLFAIDGIDLAGLVADNLGPRALPCLLIRPGAVGARDPDNLALAPAPGASTTFPFRGWIEDFSSFTKAGGLVQAGDRKVTVLAATLKTEPQPGLGRDQVTVEGKTWAIHSVVSRDPAGATFVLQVRDPSTPQGS